MMLMVQPTKDPLSSGKSTGEVQRDLGWTWQDMDSLLGTWLDMAWKNTLILAVTEQDPFSFKGHLIRLILSHPKLGAKDDLDSLEGTKAELHESPGLNVQIV